MLYLIRSFGENNQSILKLGFTDNLKKRLSTYFYYSPLYKTLSTREGDETLESLFHIYLKGLGLQFKLNGCLEEWYVDSPEILEIFELTQEELEKKIWETREECFKDSNFRNKDKDRGYKTLKSLYLKFGKSDDSFVTDEFEVKGRGEVTRVEVKEVDKLFWEVYKGEIVCQKVKIDPQEFSKENLETVRDFLDNHFYKTAIFETKLKMYCEFMDTHRGNKEIEDIIYYKIKDDRFRKYYNFYGTSGCRAKSYIDSKLLDGIYNATKEGELSRAIYRRFKLGNVYLLKEAKDILATINRDLGITSTPKASDLGRYFSLVKVKVTNPETHKRDNGFRLEPLF